MVSLCASVDGVARMLRLRPSDSWPTAEPKRYRMVNGYIELRWTDLKLTCLEHKWVMRELGGIGPGVHVHHRNKVRDDNRPENLKVVAAKAHRAEHIDRAKRTAVCLAYTQLGSTTKVAQALGMNCGTVWRMLHDEGIATPGQSTKVQVDVDLIRDLHAHGLGATLIARALGTTLDVVTNRFREHGLRHRVGAPSGDARRYLAQFMSSAEPGNARPPRDRVTIPASGVNFGSCRRL